MAGAYKTPGVYIVEKNAFPNSVVEVATAVPAFIGYTEIASNKGASLKNKPWRISSMSEFVNFFGGAPNDKFAIDTFPSEDANVKNAPNSDFRIGDDEYQLLNTKSRNYLYYGMKLFFQNGGGACYVVSVGDYQAKIEKAALESAFDELLKEQEPTMIVIPDAMSLSMDDCISLQQASLMHCGGKMKNRFSILDIYDGYKDRRDDGDCIAKFRNALGTSFLDFGSAYYPWANTSIVQLSDLGFSNIADLKKLSECLKAEVNISTLHQDKKDAYNEQIDSIESVLAAAEKLKADKKATAESDSKKTAEDRAKERAALEAMSDEDKKKAKEDADRKTKAEAEISSAPAELHKTLFTISPLYVKILSAIQVKLNLLPPSAAMAGVYTLVDNSRGVWKAPANVSLASVVSPSVNITHDEQEDLNVTTAGKSINAIRSFIGEGTLVWGARTLDGNSLDWRYINVRRTMIMLEESLRLATKAYVFEPNVSGTWVTIKSMASNFLTGIWKRGGLAGASPEDAFSVHVGLGETMTAEDILEGILRVTILVALSRPAEFIEITFQQQMQKS
ncbi:phage tail sheath subtilisin-like domain-containing protein [Undibacterium sp. FT79W]|uniref:phage tail sheath family protein n=1 Tax=Undibacterium sp. FT79W TaxID=2762296 RepID=UPI00164C7FDC|nr:phage tail sheath C-terminal domain-containing protein [Undibacterium sp. FT79W]MBC3877216.1 phage tail sheath subtilisin-like domain-containing protein [Undibacterium sp. FT79W]